MRYSFEPSYVKYVKGYGFLSFAKNMSNKYSQNLIDSAKIAKKLFQKEQLKKTAEETGDLIGNKIADKITSFSKKSPKELHPQNDDKI